MTWGVTDPRSWIVYGKQLLTEAKRDQLGNGAAALAFYMMLALFPAAIFGLSLLPYLPIPHLQQAILDLMGQLLPESAADLFTSTVESILSQRNGGLLSFGFLFAIWSASTGMYAVMQQLNVVYDVREQRPFWRARSTALLLTLLFFALVTATFALVIFGGMIQDWLAERLGFSAALRLSFAVFRWVVIAFALLCAFALVYRFAPHQQARLKLFSPGNIVAAAAFLAASFGFRVYVSRFATYNTTYGSLGAVIVLLLWLFMAGWVILIGGELNHVIETNRAGAARTHSHA